jgi:hypothetical protein
MDRAYTNGIALIVYLVGHLDISIAYEELEFQANGDYESYT